jgi:hypothetical protein
MGMESKINSSVDVTRGHETSDAHFKSVVISAAGLFALMIFGLLISLGLLSILKSRSADPGKHPDTFVEIHEGTLPPKPRIQSNPHAALVALRATEDSLLTSYGWVNGDSGVARIPIDRAMELLLRKGLTVQLSK